MNLLSPRPSMLWVAARPGNGMQIRFCHACLLVWILFCYILIYSEFESYSDDWCSLWIRKESSVIPAATGRSAVELSVGRFVGSRSAGVRFLYLSFEKQDVTIGSILREILQSIFNLPNGTLQSIIDLPSGAFANTKLYNRYEICISLFTYMLTMSPGNYCQ